MAMNVQRIETEDDLDAALANVGEGLWVNNVGHIVLTPIGAPHPRYDTILEIKTDLKPALFDRLPDLPLTRLRLSRMDLDVGEIERIATALPGLTGLHLSGNGIGSDGAQAIAETLTGLEHLVLADNQIGDTGARAIAETLKGLKTLFLSRNKVGDYGVSAIAQSLTGLRDLYLAHNGIGDGGARAIAYHLTGLRCLELEGNQIGEAGGRALLKAFSGRALSILDLGKNPLTRTLLTPEAFETPDAESILAAWAAHTRAAEGGRLVPLDEAKMLVLGDEAVGKTSLVRFLIHDRPRDPDERATRGTSLHERITTEGWTPESGGIRLNVWDFGGQEIQHGTHRYFLTRRSLYLVVLEDRREDKGEARAAKWLGVIKGVAGNEAPVLIVINKCDGAPQLTFDEDGLRRDFPQVRGILRVACNDDDDSRARIRDLRAAIAGFLTAETMPHLRDPLPAEWVAVRNAVADMAGEQPVLDHHAYCALCTDDAVTDGHPVKDQAQQGSLLLLLHDLGTVIAHGLDRDRAVALSGVRLLDPNWLTRAIYTILERVKVAEQGGAFMRDDLAAWLDPAIYPEERHGFIIDMMRDPALELCFRLPGDADRFLAPEGLPQNSPDYGALTQNALRFRYRYDDLPRALIPRLIVKLHDSLKDPEKAWLTGAWFCIGRADVIVEGDRVKQMIDVAVLGEDRRAALFTLRDMMDKVHALYQETGARAMVPMPDDPAVEELYDHLLELEREEGGDYQHRPTGAKRAFTVAKLLDAVDAERRPTVDAKDDSPPPQPPQPPPPAPMSPAPHRRSWWKRLVVGGQGLFLTGMGAAGLIGAARLGLGVSWLALAALAGLALGVLVMRLFDRTFLFRRLVATWAGIGLSLLGAAGLAARFQWQGMDVTFGGPPAWTVVAIWVVGLAILGFLAHAEMRDQKDP